MGGRVNYSGLVIAGVGFFLTRFTVTLALYESAVGFYLAGIVPLALGLGLAAFGVALAVADVDAGTVRTAAVWCVVGTGAMGVLVALTLLGAAGGIPTAMTLRSQTVLSNFLIGGSVGGTLTGLYAARNRRQRHDLRSQANRLAVLNRLLRHEVLNSLGVIRGFGTLRDVDPDERSATVDRHVTGIEATIEEVGYLTRSAQTTGQRGDPTDLDAALTESLATVRERYPDAELRVDGPTDTRVLANERLAQALTHLLENAVVYAETKTPTVEVRVTETDRAVRVAVTDEGPGLPADRRRLLETGEISRFDDPERGYGLNVVRLLVESFDGEIETSVTDAGSTVTLVLPRARPVPGGVPTPATLEDLRPAFPHLVVTLGAALVAGVVYGLASELMGGSVSVIGVFYGIDNAVVGWLTHQFHSVVFGFAFAGLLTLLPARYRESLLAYLAVGAGWGVVLWFVAAGIVSAIWLRLLGFSASLPSLSGTLLVTHLLWGLSLALLVAAGYQYLTPWMARVGARFRGRFVRA